MMKKRMLSMALILTLLSAPAAGCGAEGIQGVSENKMLSAKKIEAEGITCIDYSEPSMQPVQEFSYQLLASHLEKKNPVFSPVSAYTALCMAANGAKGKTKKELQQVLGEDLKCLPDYVMNILPQDKESITLQAANSAWIDKAFKPEKKWVTDVVSLFDASIYKTDLDTNAARKEINQWVCDHTNKMIKELLDKNLEKNARLALLNALYFQAEWENKFEGNNTVTQDFYLDNGSVAEAPLMYQLYSGCEYLKDQSCEGVVLPYADSSYAFVAVKPLGDQSIRKWYQSYSAEKLRKLIAGRTCKNVDVGLLKFKVNCRENLVEGLKEMGISRAFDANKANFSGIGTSGQENNLYISNVLQEAVIEVAEEGTKASAATVVDMSDGGGMAEVVPVVFNRSFLYIIMDMEHEMPVFIGIIDQPQQ